MRADAIYNRIDVRIPNRAYPAVVVVGIVGVATPSALQAALHTEDSQARSINQWLSCARDTNSASVAQPVAKAEMN
jgi:hypothetical protein